MQKYSLEINDRAVVIDLPENVIDGLRTGEIVTMPRFNPETPKWLTAVDFVDRNERVVFHWDNPNSEPLPEVGGELLSSPGISFIEARAVVPQKGDVVFNPANICLYQEATVPGKKCTHVTFSGNVQIIFDIPYPEFTKLLQSVS